MYPQKKGLPSGYVLDFGDSNPAPAWLKITSLLSLSYRCYHNLCNRDAFEAANNQYSTEILVQNSHTWGGFHKEIDLELRTTYARVRHELTSWSSCLTQAKVVLNSRTTLKKPASGLYIIPFFWRPGRRINCDPFFGFQTFLMSRANFESFEMAFILMVVFKLWLKRHSLPCSGSARE